MSLLQALNLPVPRHLPPPGGGAPPPPTKPAPMAMRPPPTQGGAKPPPQALAKPPGGEANPRAEALKLRGAVESRRAQALELLVRLQKVLPLLTSRVASTTGDEQKKLVDQHALLVRSIDDTKSKLARAEADLRVIDNAGSKDEELAAVIDRQRKAPKTGDITAPALEPPKQAQAEPTGAPKSGSKELVKKDLDKDKTFKSKGGAKAGAGLKLHANVKCEIGEPTGEPKLYPVTLTVSFAGAVALSGGVGDKKGSKGKGSIDVKGSTTKQMVVKRQLNETELASYTRLLETASKGNQVADARKEFAIIAAGANSAVGWGVARALYDKQTAKDVTDDLKAGDSVEFSDEKEGSIGAKGSRGPVDGSLNHSEKKRNATEIKRNDKGEHEVAGKQEYGSKTDGSVGVKSGAVGMQVGGEVVHEVRTGYLFAIDPRVDPGGKILEELRQCKTDDDYLAVFARHPGKLRRIGTTVGKTDSGGYNVGVTIAGQTAKIGNESGVKSDEKLDAKGRVVSRNTEGYNKSGGQVSKWADSKREVAKAETGADGEVSFQVESIQEKNTGDRAKARKKEQEKVKKAGGEAKDEDAVERNVSGIKLASKLLARLGEQCRNSLASWNDWCFFPSEKKDWKQAGIEIVKGKGTADVVAHELAKFVGGDIDRKKIVQNIARGGRRNTGKAYEFPDRLRGIRDDYDTVTDDALPKKMHALAKKKGEPAAAEECRRLLVIADRIYPQIVSCDDFSSRDVKTEMMTEVTGSRAMINRGILSYSGKNPADDPNVLIEEGGKLFMLCQRFGAEEVALVAQMEEIEDDPKRIRADEKIAGRKLLRQLEAMHQRWRPSFDQLRENYAKRKMPPLPETLDGKLPLAPRSHLVAKYEKRFGAIS